MEDPDEPPSAEGSIHNRRYFRCPANLPIGHLVRFLRCKFDVVDPAINKVRLKDLNFSLVLAAVFQVLKIT